jgi:hypothetical protein
MAREDERGPVLLLLPGQDFNGAVVEGHDTGQTPDEI